MSQFQVGDRVRVKDNVPVLSHRGRTGTVKTTYLTTYLTKGVTVKQDEAFENGITQSYYPASWLELLERQEVPTFSAGDRVTVLEGPLEALVGTVDGTVDGDVVILTDEGQGEFVRVAQDSVGLLDDAEEDEGDTPDSLLTEAAERAREGRVEEARQLRQIAYARSDIEENA